MTGRSLLLLCLSIAFVSAAGCESVLHNLKPHRLHRLNRVHDGMPSEAYMSVSDPEAEGALDATGLDAPETER